MMTTTLVAVSPATSVVEAADLAEYEGVHHLVVMDRGALVGVVCEYDLVLAGPDAVVGDCMSAPPYCIDVGATPAEAALAMQERAIGSLPVMAGGIVLGIVTRGDLRRAGLAPADIAPPLCASCGRDDHVRLDQRTEGAAFCLDCRDDGVPSTSDDDVGNGG
jgi:predicted transcriptional regulator